MRFAAQLMVVAALATTPRALGADPPLPVVVSSVGPKALRVRVATFGAGFVFPCSSSSNTQLFEGALEPGQQVMLQTADGCVCVEHTYDDFPDANWSMGQLACRPVICRGFGKARTCWPDPDPTIRIAVSSSVR